MHKTHHIFLVRTKNNGHNIWEFIKPTSFHNGNVYKSELTKDTPYLALTGKLCDVYCEYFGET